MRMPASLFSASVPAHSKWSSPGWTRRAPLTSSTARALSRSQSSSTSECLASTSATRAARSVQPQAPSTSYTPRALSTATCARSIWSLRRRAAPFCWTMTFLGSLGRPATPSPTCAPSLTATAIPT
eukprot:Amastigsp_a1490_34.p3 type:complete len:126 gc:universal Amastigsp_a1490_34:754-377(-)